MYFLNHHLKFEIIISINIYIYIYLEIRVNEYTKFNVASIYSFQEKKSRDIAISSLSLNMFLKLFPMGIFIRDNGELRNQRNSNSNDMEDSSLAKSLATDSDLNIIAASCVFPFPLFVVNEQNFRRNLIISVISNT